MARLITALCVLVLLSSCGGSGQGSTAEAAPAGIPLEVTNEFRGAVNLVAVWNRSQIETTLGRVGGEESASFNLPSRTGELAIIARATGSGDARPSNILRVSPGCSATGLVLRVKVLAGRGGFDAQLRGASLDPENPTAVRHECEQP